MVAVLTILAFGAMGRLIAAISHASITRERRAILAAQAQIADATAQDQADAGAKPAPSISAKALRRRSKLDVQRSVTNATKQKRIRMK
jgi:hypothetical protein